MRCWLLCAAVTMMAGCEQDMSDLSRYMNQVKARQPAPIEPIPVIKPYVRFIYPGHEIDPFDASILQVKNTPDIPDSVIVDKNRVPEFLEAYPLDSLRMVGTVFKENELWALIKLPDGAVHRVKKGNYLGKNHGKITSIKDIGIALSEIVDNGFGGFKERDNELSISSPNKPL